MLLHAKQRWPNAVTTNLWPYAMRMANEVSNFSPGIRDGISPLEKFAQLAIIPRVKHSHTFGSPVYVLDNRSQGGKSVPKWDQKSRIGMYLGTSPRHSRRVALVLNLQTGHVSPQFHVVFDDLFETLRPSTGNLTPVSLWQAETGFVQSEASGRSENIVKEPGAQSDDPEVGVIPSTDATPEVALGDSANSAEETTATVMTRAGRVTKPTQKWIESIDQRDGVQWADRHDQQMEDAFAMHVSWEVFHDDGYQIQDDMEDPIAFVASSNPDIMYYDQAMKEPDSKQFE